MLNLLPLTEKKKVLNEYRLRFTTVVVIAVGAFIFASLELLTPSYFLSAIKFTSLQEQLTALEGKYGALGKEKDLTAQIRDINNKILLLLNGEKEGRLVPSQVLETIIKLKPAQIKISGFMYDPEAIEERVVLTGYAADRESLAAFVEVLKKDTKFTSITLPISSYVKSEDIDFSIIMQRASQAKPAAKK